MDNDETAAEAGRDGSDEIEVARDPCALCALTASGERMAEAMEAIFDLAFEAAARLNRIGALPRPLPFVLVTTATGGRYSPSIDDSPCASVLVSISASAYVGSQFVRPEATDAAVEATEPINASTVHGA